MEGDQEDMSPFWQPNRRRRHNRRPSSSFFFNSGFLLILLLSLALLFVFIIIPRFLSFTSQLLKPHSVKKGWDSLNLVLVLFAVVCGFLGRNGGGGDGDGDAERKNPFEEDHYRAINRSQDNFQRSSSSPSTPHRSWFDQDLSGSLKAYNNNGRLNRLRSFSSYPDLRAHEEEEASWGNHQWRFYDDTHLYNYRSSSSDQPPLPPPQQPVEKRGGKEEDGGGVDDVKKIGVDVDTAFVIEKEKKVVYTAPHPPPQTAEDAAVGDEVSKPPATASYPVLPTVPAPKVARRRARRSYEEMRNKNDLNDITSSSQPPPSSPPRLLSSTPQTAEYTAMGEEVPQPPAITSTPVPPTMPAPKVARRKVRTYEDIGKSERRKNNYLSEITSTSQPPPSSPPRLPSPPPQTAEFEEGGKKSEKKKGGSSATKEFFISLKGKKKNKQRQKSVENLDSFFNYESSYTLPSIPPPPPPPPPPPFFQNLFSSKKRKTKKLYSILSAPPPPPPPPPKTQQLSRKTAVKNISHTTQRPPLPVKIRSYNNAADDNVNSGGESPLNAIPPPPPLPPFNIPVWKFEVHGDYVRLKSNNDIDAEESASPSSDGGDAAAAAAAFFCPSPDVDTKADNFIKKFRHGLRLEKMNSAREKEGRVGMSNLGPRLGAEPGPS